MSGDGLGAAAAAWGEEVLETGEGPKANAGGETDDAAELAVTLGGAERAARKSNAPASAVSKGCEDGAGVDAGHWKNESKSTVPSALKPNDVLS